MKYGLLTLLFAASFTARANCVDNLSKVKVDGRTVGSQFKIEDKELKALAKPGNKVLAFEFKGDKPLKFSEEKNLYVKTLYMYDEFVADKRCPASASRVVFTYPKATVTISTKDLQRIRKHKPHGRWEGDVLYRSQFHVK
jgi:hypothetical protein